MTVPPIFTEDDARPILPNFVFVYETDEPFARRVKEEAG